MKNKKQIKKVFQSSNRTDKSCMVGKTLSDTPTGRMGSMGSESRMSGDTALKYQRTKVAEIMSKAKMSKAKKMKECETADVMKMTLTVDKYQTLIDVFDAALSMAKNMGADTHAIHGQEFERQPIVDIGLRLRGIGLGFQLGQAEKKIEEAANYISLYDKTSTIYALASRSELLGAINYLAAAIICLGMK